MYREIKVLRKGQEAKTFFPDTTFIHVLASVDRDEYPKVPCKRTARYSVGQECGSCPYLREKFQLGEVSKNGVAIVHKARESCLISEAEVKLKKRKSPSSRDAPVSHEGIYLEEKAYQGKGYVMLLI